jgi:cubilin
MTGRRYTSLLITATILIFVPAIAGKYSKNFVNLKANETVKVIYSPQYVPTNYSSSYIVSQWYITAAKPDEVVVLKLLDLSLNTSNCNFQYVDIFDGPSIASHKIQRLCGQNSTRQPITSTGLHMTIVFISYRAVVYKGFQIQYASQKPAQCGNNTLLATETAENLTSPGYPNNYPGALNCQWIITAESPSQVVVLELLDINMTSGYVCNDLVSIYDGNSTSSPRIQSLCNLSTINSAAQYISSGSDLTVVFHSGGPSTLKGFRFEYTSQEKSDLCGNGSLLATRMARHITSPGYPKNYPGNIGCQWNITAESPFHVIELKVLDFNMGNLYFCSTDNVAVYDGNSTSSQQMQKLCGALLPTQFISAGSSMTVVFNSLVFRNFKGFKLEYSSVKKSALCGHDTLTATRTTKSITSPGYPYSYPSNADCQWTVTTDLSFEVVLLNIQDMVLETESTCIYDNLTIYDGPDTNSSIIQTVCGQLSNTQFVSTSSAMTLVFHSDGSDNYQGFKLQYTSQYKLDVCNDNSLLATSTPKYLTSMSYPYNYASDLDCQWVITANSSSQIIVLNLLDFYIEYEASCNYDYVTIYDGYGQFAPLIVKKCGLATSGQFTSTGQYMTIVFHSDSTDSFKGFKFQYTSQPSSSYNTLTADGTAKYISSPNYPFSYPSNKDCQWTITSVISSQVIVLKMLDFELETSSSCIYDYVTIDDGSNALAPTILKTCGSQSNKLFISSGPSMTVEFHSDGSDNFRGFRFQYTAQFKSGACTGSTLMATSTANNLDSPNYPGIYPSNIDCQWHIKAYDSSDVVVLDLTQMNLNGFSPSCDSDYVTIHDGPSAYSSLLATLCGLQLYGSYQSTGSDLTVVFHSDGINIDNTGFRFSYTSQDQSSGFTYDNTPTVVAVVVSSITVVCLFLVVIIIVKRRKAQNQLRNTQNRVPARMHGQQANLHPYAAMQNPQMVAAGAPPGYSASYLPPPPYYYAVQAGAVPHGQTPLLNVPRQEKPSAGAASTQGGAQVNKGFSGDSTSGATPN